MVASSSRAGASLVWKVKPTAAPRSASSSTIAAADAAGAAGHDGDAAGEINLRGRRHVLTRMTALVSAPPEATLLMRTSGPGARSGPTAMFNDAHA